MKVWADSCSAGSSMDSSSANAWATRNSSRWRPLGYVPVKELLSRREVGHNIGESFFYHSQHGRRRPQGGTVSFRRIGELAPAEPLDAGMTIQLPRPGWPALGFGVKAIEQGLTDQESADGLRSGLGFEQPGRSLGPGRQQVGDLREPRERQEGFRPPAQVGPAARVLDRDSDPRQELTQTLGVEGRKRQLDPQQGVEMRTCGRRGEISEDDKRRDFLTKRIQVVRGDG